MRDAGCWFLDTDIGFAIAIESVDCAGLVVGTAGELPSEIWDVKC
jgi:hypothetical protein